MSKQKEKENQSANMKLLLRYVITDEKGKVIYDSGQKPSKSYVIAFLLYFSGDFSGTEITATDIANVVRGIYNPSIVNRSFHANAGAGDAVRGIVVGSDNTPPTNTDYKLASQFTEGTGAGQITHGAITIDDAGVVGDNVDVLITRTFTNLTGSDRVVAEVGMYVRRDLAYTPSPKGDVTSHCIIRDVLVSPKTVPDKCSITVYYTLRTTV